MDKKKKKQLTMWDNPTSRLNSQYGNIGYLDWCQREAERIGKGALVEKRDDGLVCLMTEA